MKEEEKTKNILKKRTDTIHNDLKSPLPSTQSFRKFVTY